MLIVSEINIFAGRQENYLKIFSLSGQVFRKDFKLSLICNRFYNDYTWIVALFPQIVADLTIKL